MIVMKRDQKVGKTLLMIVVLLLATVGIAVAQDSRDGKSAGKDERGIVEIRSLLEKAQRAYREAAYLGFSVRYLYANESRPDKPLDSLTGEVDMDKGRCRFSIDGIETLVTDKYTVQVIKEERIIYLSGAKHISPVDPLNLLDSILHHMQGIRTQVEPLEGADRLTLLFPPGQQYRSISMTMDRKTGFFQRISYALHTKGLVGDGQLDRPGHPGPYQSEGRIEIGFSDYRQGRFGEERFDEQRFFKRLARHFEPAAGYRDYQIFLASSNL
jgi:hypothetical protein